MAALCTVPSGQDLLRGSDSHWPLLLPTRCAISAERRAQADAGQTSQFREEARLWNPWVESLSFDFQSELHQQLEEATAKVQVLQEELSTLRHYINGHYAEEDVKIVFLQHSIENLKKQQQVLRPLLPCSIPREEGEGREEGTQWLSSLTLLLFLCAASHCPQVEIEKTEKMVEAMLEQLQEKAQAEQEAMLQKVVEVCEHPSK